MVVPSPKLSKVTSMLLLAVIENSYQSSLSAESRQPENEVVGSEPIDLAVCAVALPVSPVLPPSF